MGNRRRALGGVLAAAIPVSLDDAQGQLLDHDPAVTLTAAGQTLVPADHA